jgi:LytS/YehU family sensor histidine kinase
MPIYLFSTHWYLQQANFRNFSSFFLLMFVASMIFVFFQKSLEIQLKNKVVEMENIQLKSEKFSAELDHLKKQIDPHFLFNSFTVLHSLIRNDSKLAEQYLLNLTDLYRNILRNYSENTVSLEEELNLINSYLHLQKARFENGLHVDIQINKDVMRHQIPIFSLQLLFENCIKHNIVSDEKPLYITVFQKENTFLCVKNNLQLKIRNEDSTGKGLANLKRRYELLGISDGMSIEQNQQSYSVTIKLL